MVSATGTGPFGAPGELAHPAENANRITAVAIPSRTRNGRIFGTSANSSSARNSGIHRQAGGAGTGKRVRDSTDAFAGTRAACLAMDSAVPRAAAVGACAENAAVTSAAGNGHCGDPVGVLSGMRQFTGGSEGTGTGRTDHHRHLGHLDSCRASECHGAVDTAPETDAARRPNRARR